MFELKQIPNVITICRILIIFPTLWLLYFDQYKDALVLLIIAGLSDALDGYLARAFNWKTRLGSIMDPIADKFLIASSFLVLLEDFKDEVLTDDKYQKIRKRVLDNGNDTIRELEEHLDSFNITIR